MKKKKLFNTKDLKLLKKYAKNRAENRSILAILRKVYPAYRIGLQVAEFEKEL